MIEELIKGLILAFVEIASSDGTVEERADALDKSLADARTQLRTGVEQEILDRQARLDLAVPPK